MKFPTVRVVVANGQKEHYSRVWLATGSDSPEFGKEAGAPRMAKSGQLFRTGGAGQCPGNSRNELNPELANLCLAPARIRQGDHQQE